jgi:hypothetical protein
MLYDASENEVRPALVSLEFMENSNVGDVDAPVRVGTEYALEALGLTEDSIAWDAGAGATVATIFALNENEETVDPAYEFVQDSLGEDNGYFSIEDNALVLEQGVDPGVKSSYRVHLRGTIGEACAVDGAFVLAVSGNGTSGVADGEERNPDGLAVFPNPASDKVYFTAPQGGGVVRVYDLTGCLAGSVQALSGLQSIDVSGWAVGVYWVVYRVDGGIQSQQVVIQR